MFAIRKMKERIYIREIDKIVKPSITGMSSWVIFKGKKKPKIVSNNKIFETEEEAGRYLKNYLKAIKKRD